jgi:hypothetical protein
VSHDTRSFQAPEDDGCSETDSIIALDNAPALTTLLQGSSAAEAIVLDDEVQPIRSSKSPAAGTYQPYTQDSDGSESDYSWGNGNNDAVPDESQEVEELNDAIMDTDSEASEVPCDPYGLEEALPGDLESSSDGDFENRSELDLTDNDGTFYHNLHDDLNQTLMPALEQTHTICPEALLGGEKHTPFAIPNLLNPIKASSDLETEKPVEPAFGPSPSRVSPRPWRSGTPQKMTANSEYLDARKANKNVFNSTGLDSVGAEMMETLSPAFAPSLTTPTSVPATATITAEVVTEQIERPSEKTERPKLLTEPIIEQEERPGGQSEMLGEQAAFKAGEAATANPEAPSNRDFEQVQLTDSSLLASGTRFLHSAEMAVWPDEDVDEQEDPEPLISAAILHQQKLIAAERALRVSSKRKADEISRGNDVMLAEEPVSVQIPSPVTEPPVQPPPKRVKSGALKTNKSIAWAIAEKLGIAALGGTAVLAALIYSAPEFV